ncbi:exopolyphosphatase [Desulfobacter sp.]|jgi:oligoribonuclease NrnB/cAMP/cGMP phosphodiesterase (DHH superfamily)|uniref:exopolyphosphatase n=1 Tax=Desulfobacter sp. TaxID=2294 RepID=UPI000E9DEB12|nr:exopolyphosphatase [Desulfobacter sp.]MBP9598935.1 exopolyphosphatase [Desulfobacter sp.]HBT89753.1 exopolyphosphatase [Desulfobacter sp.]
MRIVTRPDFDGIVCAVLLRQALEPSLPICWIEPNAIQSGTADIRDGDILANLPWHPNAYLWFDHHISNKPAQDVPGLFEIAPSAAGVIYNYYQKQHLLDNRFDELVDQTDMIDSADLTREQVKAPENYPYLLLSMTIKNNDFQDIPYWERLVDMLGKADIKTILEDPEVDRRCREVIEENKAFKYYLETYTTMVDRISVTDFRALENVPSGNRFLIYSLFADAIASVKIRYARPDKKQVLISVGHSIFNPECRINAGTMLACYGGGGHFGAGGCTVDARDAQDKIDEILDILKANKRQETRDK